MFQNKCKICVVTGTRADYGLMYWVLKELETSARFELQLIVTGMHLSPEFGLTYKAIEHDGFSINYKIEMLTSSDTPVGIAKAIGLGTIGFADAFAQLQPDILMLFGDRYELLAAAQSALVARIPIAHVFGGDTTEGAFDEAIRHSITKMSHLHFVSNAKSAQRVKQLGEDPARVFTVGSPALDHIHHLKLLSRKELSQALEFEFKKQNFIVTFHPVTLENNTSEQQFKELLLALDELGTEAGIIFTLPNSDTNGRAIIKLIGEFTATHSHAKAFTSLGQLKYLSAIRQVDAVIGNSSSGIYEVPSFGKPTVNIGDRQKGRLQATTVINCEAKKDSILEAVKQSLEMNCLQAVNPYGDGHSAKKIVGILESIQSYQELLKKHFFEVAESGSN